MDYNRTSTKILDSWDFINLPVKQPHREHSIDDSGNYPRVRAKGARKKLAHRKEPFRNRKKPESSTSLILNKADKQVFNDYSVLSFTNILQSHSPVYGDFYAKQPADDKPLIKVTVFPKTDTKAGNSKRKDNLQKNWSRKKPENSINNKNVYLVVAGRKREKVYELNTRTVKYSVGSLRENDSSATECANIKELLKINLNKCKKSISNLQIGNIRFTDGLLAHGFRYDCESADAKFRRKEEVKVVKMSKNKTNSTQRPKKNMQVSEEFRVTVPIKDGKKSYKETQKISPRPSSNVTGQKSRVRITGRLGLTHDDRFVLKCNATVDDEPIATFPLSENLMPMAYAVEDSSRPPRNQRDSNVQADVRYFTNPSFGQASQATQVNLELFYPQNHCAKQIANHDKMVQCFCTNIANVNYMSDERGDIALKECNSPVVIISVYPQQESSDKVNSKTLAEDMRTPHVEFHEKNPKKVTKKEEVKNKPRPLRSRSPSPVRNAVKDKNSKEVKSWVSTTSSKKQLRDGTVSTVKSTKTKSSKVQTISQGSSSVGKKVERPRSPSPASPRLSSPTRRAGSPKIKQKNTTATNTEQALTKKALVDSFTKQYTAQMNDRNVKDGPGLLKSKQDVSNVTVNIEGDNDFYNVMFRQGPVNTDLTVRKTQKGNMANYPRDNDSTSLENFLLMEPENHRLQTSFSQTFISDTENPPVQITTTPKFNVRDSIEVCHWREDTPCNAADKTAQTNTSCNRIEVDNTFLAPIKHFQGDECSISDPHERDKEIRELLGIDKGRFKPPTQDCTEASAIFGERNEVSLTCLFRDHSVSVCQSKIKDLAGSPKPETRACRHWILNRNVQVLLQINQVNKHQPIVLSRQQYAKVRKSIYSSLMKKNSLDRHLRSGFKNSSVSIGSIRVKPKLKLTFHYNKQTQTDPLEMATTKKTYSMYGSTKRDPDLTKETVNKGNDAIFSCELGNHAVKESATSSHKSLDRRRSVFSNQLAMTSGKHSLSIKQNEMSFLFDASFAESRKKSKEDSFTSNPRKAASSLEVYAKVSYSKQVKFSSTDLAYLETHDSIHHSIGENLEQKESHSIHTLFKGHRRCHTPNLGTSAYSLCPESASEHSHNALFKGFKPADYDLKPKKPFLRTNVDVWQPLLRRLISCLVMRASRTSAAKFPEGLPRKQPSLHSSIDSYHINTSLGGIDMTSSMYDTSASFYSNHTIQPVSKMKRGFFSSVRGFLGTRRS